VDRIQRTWQNKKYEEFIPPEKKISLPTPLPYGYFESQKCAEGLSFSENGLDGKLYLILVSFNSAQYQ
jgi:hypothetical protein